MHATSATGSRGFTLVELLVVLAILVMFASILPLALERGLPSRRVAAAAQNTMSAIRDAQAVSAAKGRIIELQVGKNGLTDGESVLVAIPPTTHVTLLSPDGVALGAIAIYPDGTVTDARLSFSERKHTRTIRLSSLTGRVTMERTDAS